MHPRTIGPVEKKNTSLVSLNIRLCNRFLTVINDLTQLVTFTKLQKTDGNGLKVDCMDLSS